MQELKQELKVQKICKQKDYEYIIKVDKDLDSLKHQNAKLNEKH